MNLSFTAREDNTWFPVGALRALRNAMLCGSEPTWQRVVEAGVVRLAEFFNIADTEKRRQQSGRRYLEFLRIPSLSAGVYVLPSGGADTQSPHKEDEMYYVVRGCARMRAGSDDQPVTEGSVIFVAAGTEHRFYDITEELTVLVFFAPAESE
jgi:mannose-6-phosphate isomerase-like protein (cupin superfamily)